MIIVLNGYPGVGKLAIGRQLAAQLEGRLLDIHSVYNVAFALTEFKSPAFRDAVERVEAIAHDLILRLPAAQPVVLTTVIAGQSPWGDAEWQKLVALGRQRPPFLVVHVSCDLDENIRRIESEDRDLMRKPRHRDYAIRNQAEGKTLADAGADRVLKLDTTHISAEASAAAIRDWALGA